MSEVVVSALIVAAKWLFLVVGLAMPLTSLLTWAERRQSAMIQDRRGPNRANIGPIRLKGILHFIADAVKLIFKEDCVPKFAHKRLFALAPILALAPVLIAFAIIPFGPTVYPHALFESINPLALHKAMAAGTAATNPLWKDAISLQAYQVDFGLLFYFAILSIANYGAAIAGWASYNKWALLGGLRACSQMISYEVSMGLALVGVFLITGTLEPGAIVNWQGSNPLHWGVVVQFPAFILFFTAAIAETKRGPFDLPEGESEIIGYFVEYSGMRWGMFFLAEFIEVVFIAAVITTVFFGGYHVPFLQLDGFHLFGLHFHLQHWSVVLLQFAAFGIKVVTLCLLQLSIRWTLPRFRPDQLLKLGWKILLPLALANVMITALVRLWLLPPS